MEMGREQAFLTKADQSLDKTTSGPSGPFGNGERKVLWSKDHQD